MFDERDATKGMDAHHSDVTSRPEDVFNSIIAWSKAQDGKGDETGGNGGGGIIHSSHAHRKSVIYHPQ